MVQAMQIVKDKPKDFLVISGMIWLLCQWFLLEVQGHIRYRAGFSKGVLWNDTVSLNRKVDEAFKIQYLLSDCIDMIFEQGNPAGIKQVFDSLGSR
jgi:4-hydroxy-tetrahydrodipicolinate synthase